jgi:hypothetical protein
MVTSDITPSSDWKGPFTWDGLFLRMHIPTVRKLYDQKDPRTWPLIRKITSTEACVDYRRSKMPPRILAYEQSLMAELEPLWPMKNNRFVQRASDLKPVSYRFLYYPFNFDQEGTLREFPHLPSKDYQVWLKFAPRLPDRE